MQRIMDIVDIAFYHEKLPPLPYYENKDNRIIFSHIPHGIYPPAEEDKDIAKIFQGLKSQGLTTLSITGNIRAEKNYKIAIDAVAQIPDTVLIIAGRSVTVTCTLSTDGQLAVNHEHLLLSLHADGCPEVLVPTLSGQHLG